jgi:hypothetical protein
MKGITIKNLFFSYLFFLMSTVINGQGYLGMDLKVMDDIKVTLLTCDSGDQLYSTFGHSAIRVLYEKTGEDVVYNYGTFDQNTPGFYMKFMRGKLPYRLSRSTYAAFLYEYNYFKRGVKEQVLNLDSEQELELIAFLENNYLPENREYAYDFFFDNCATRIRDLIPEVAPGSSWSTETSGVTFRDLLHEFLPGMPWSEFGIDLIIGAVADQPCDVEDQMFLPAYLFNQFASANAGADKALVEETHQILIFEEEAVARRVKPWFTPHVIFLLLIFIEFAIVFLIKKKSKAVQWYNKLFFFSIGLASVLMMLLWFATDHQATGNNWNILWASPLFLVFPWMKRSTLKKYIGYFLIAASAISLLNVFIQFLPQDFSSYNVLLYGLIMWKVWKCIARIGKPE